MTRIQLAFIGAATVIHIGMYVGMGLLPKEKKYDAVAIALEEAKKHEPKKAPPPPPPPPPPKKVETKAAKVAPEPKETVAPAPETKTESSDSLDGFTDLGLPVMSGDGIALPTKKATQAGPTATSEQKTTKTVERKAARALTAAEPGCDEDVTKPGMERQVQPAYTLEAKQANVEGKVRLEVTIDATGHVTSVKVIKGLGFGLDEAATAAVKQWAFKPATKCGKPVPTTIKLGVNFGFK